MRNSLACCQSPNMFVAEPRQALSYMLISQFLGQLPQPTPLTLTTYVGVLVLSFASCVPLFSHLQNENSNDSYLTVLFWGTSESIHVTGMQ